MKNNCEREKRNAVYSFSGYNNTAGVMKLEKINTLLPTLKTKKRYIAYEIICKKEIKKDDFKKAFLAEGLRLFGELGMADMEAVFIKQKNNKGFMKVKLGTVDKARSVFALIKEINNNQTIVRSIIASGTIKSLTKKIESL